MLRSRTSVTALVSAAFALLTSAGCGTNPSGGSGTTAKQPAAKAEKFASADAAIRAMLSPITPPQDQLEAKTWLTKQGTSVVTQLAAALPEPGDSGWTDEPLGVAETFAELAPTTAPERADVIRKATAASEKYKAAIDRRIRLAAMAGQILGDPGGSIGRLQERHEKLVASLRSPSR